MQKKLHSYFIAFGSTGLLLLGGIALWFSSDTSRAIATTKAVVSEDLPALPEPLAPEPELVVPPAPKKSKEEKRFARVDRDDDGIITQSEYLHLRKRNFDKLDVNGDGRLSFEEYAISGLEKFNKADANGDKKLVPAEFATTAPKPKKAKQQTAQACKCSTQTASIDGLDAD